MHTEQGTPIASPAHGFISQIFFTESELAAELRVHVRTLRRWASLQLGPPRTRAAGKKSILYSRNSVLAWLQASQERQHSPARSKRSRIRN
jgi:hypothetical protein